MHHAFLYVRRKQLSLDNCMRLSACFLSCLLSRPQTAAALHRNTRPSTHDAPLPVHGQETIRPVTLPHYRAGKVSFFCPPLSKLQQDNMQGLTELELLIFLSKKRQIPVPFFCLPGHYYCRIFAFVSGTQAREEGFISWSKENFFLRATAGITGRPLEQPIRIEDSLDLARSRNQSYYRKL